MPVMTAREALLPMLLTGILVSWATFGPLHSLMVRPPSGEGLPERIPGQDHIPPTGRVASTAVKIGALFERFDTTYPAEMRGAWPGFRGPNATNVSREDVRLLASFSHDGPPVLWRRELGEGHAAPAIFNGRVFLLDYLEREKADALRCFSLLDGKELWRRSYAVDIKRNHGYSRTVPAVGPKQTVTIGPLGHVMGVETDSGDLLWTLDLAARFQTVIPQWYTGQCPLLDGETVVLAPGGPNTLLIGVEASSGRILWETPNPGGWAMSHSSVVPMVFRERRMYVYAAQGGIIGVAADGEDRGAVLWQIGDWGATIVAPSPVVLPEGRLYQSAGYGAGSVVISLSGEQAPFAARIEHRFNPREALATEQQSATFFRDLLVGVLPKDAGTRRMMLVACDPRNPSRYVFAGEHELRFGLGPYLVADDRFFALADDGTLSMLTFAGQRFVRTGHSKVLPGVDAWGPLAIADGLLLVRDSTSMACLDLTHDARWAGRRTSP
jgi:outer membrane protein assembly factor BamB